MQRQCGECTLCCKLLPVVSLDKKANEKCQFQKFHKGCGVYNTSKMPLECHVWNCRWLVNDDTADLSRPDRSHYVVDLFPDWIGIRDNDTGEEQRFEVVQIWCDPNHPEAHRDPKLREFLMRRAKERIIGMIRYNSWDMILIIAPELNKENKWIEIMNKANHWRPEQLLTDAMVKAEYEDRNK
jgi:hypothetical protein